jgi:hypothetical protein
VIKLIKTLILSHKEPRLGLALPVREHTCVLRTGSEPGS